MILKLAHKSKNFKGMERQGDMSQNHHPNDKFFLTLENFNPTIYLAVNH
jgi:hypothetical protein